jgi:hypothetical protein
MAIKEKPLRLKRTTRLTREGSFLAGAGRYPRLPVGINASAGRRERAYLRTAENRIPASFFATMYQVKRVELWGYRLPIDRIDHGTAGRLRIRRATDGRAEGTAEDLSSGNALVWPGAPTTSTGQVRSPDLGGATGKWVRIASDVLPLIRHAIPAGLGGDGGEFLGLMLAQDEDDWSSSPGYTSTTNNTEWASDDHGDGSKAPYLNFVYDDNIPPELPTVISPEPSGGGDAVQVATASGTELTVVFDFNDADDTVCRHVQLEVHPNAITDATVEGATPTVTSGVIAPTATGTNRRYSVRVTGLPARTDQRFRLRVRDPKDAWSPWTSLADGRIETAYVPGVPLQPLMQTDPEGAHIFGTISSEDTSDHVTGWEGEFYRDNADGSTTTLWAPGKVVIGGSSTRSDVTYGGVQLNDGDQVRWRHRHYNRDDVEGAWSPFYTTVMKTQVGPTITPSDTSTRLTSRTGPITIAAASFDGYQYRLYRGDVLIHDSALVGVSATTSTAVSFPAGVINWGDTLGIEAAVRPAGTGSLGPFSPRTFLYVTTLPTTTLSVSDGEGHTGTVVPTMDPLFAIPYLDPDRASHGEAPAGQELEIRVAASPPGTGALVTKRTSVVGIRELRRTGRQIEALDSATGWSAAAGATVSAHATNPTDYGGTSLKVAISGLLTGTSTQVSKTLGIPTGYLASLPGDDIFSIWSRASSLTNLNTLLLAVDGDGWSASWTIKPGSIDTWTEFFPQMAAPTNVAGTVDWATAATVRVSAAASGGTYTGDVFVRDWRAGTTQTDKTVPDRYLIPEETYDIRARYRDDADARVSTTLAADYTAGGTNVKLASVTGLLVGDDLTIVTTSRVETRTITVIGTAGSGGTGVTVSEAYVYNHTSGDAVRVYPWGPWTSWTTVKPSPPPEVTADTPATHAVITDPTPALEHTFSSPGSKDQASHRTDLYRRRGQAARVLAGNQRARWRLGEASGTPATDDANGHSGTYTNSPTLGVTGAMASVDHATAARFDGSNDHVLVATHADLHPGDTFTIRAWIRKDVDGATMAILSAGVDDYLLRINSSNLLELRKANVQAVLTSSVTITGTDWHRVIVTKAGATMACWVDGVMDPSPTLANATIVAGSNNVSIGREWWGGAYWDGDLQDVSIEARQIEDDEAIADWDARSEIPGDELLFTRTTDDDALEDTLPVLLLEHLGVYAWQVTAADTDGLTGTTAVRDLLTVFTAPAAVTDLVATADDATSSITLAWTASSDPDLAFYVVRWRDITDRQIRIDLGPRELGDGREPMVDATFTWYGGRIGSNEFQVTVHDGTLESAPASVEVALASARPGSWMATGEDDRYTFPFDPTDVPRSRTGTVMTYRPPGRPFPVHHHWGSSGRTVSLRFTYLPDEDDDLVTLMDELHASGQAFWVKAPPGYRWDVMRVKVVGVSDTVEPYGWVSVALDLDEVAFDA